MASERDFELLDDYVGNRLSEAEKASFESRLQADPELQRELKLQQGIVASLRKARAAELKAMLNSIPPSAIPANSTRALTWAGVTLAALIAIGLFFYLRPSENPTVEHHADSSTVAPPVVDPSPQAETPASEDQSANAPKKNGTQTPEAKTRNENATETTKAPVTPGSREVDVFDPEAEDESEVKAPDITAPENVSEGSAKTSDIVSEIVSDHRTYDFHYQFKGEKLILYGSFDKNLYSILEFFSDDKRTIFLEYKDSFYLLNPAGEKVKPLSAVNDPVLINKLKEH